VLTVLLEMVFSFGISGKISKRLNVVFCMWLAYVISEIIKQFS